MALDLHIVRTIAERFMSSRSSNVERQQRRRQVEGRYLEGAPIAEIAAELGVEAKVVSNDLRWLRAAWLRERETEGALRLEIELRKIDRLEREAWTAWLRSQKDFDSTKVSRDGAKEKAEKTVRRQTGDPRFLAVVKDCIDRRCRLLGMLATSKKKTVGEKPLPAVEVVVDSAEELERLWSVDDLLERLGREKESTRNDSVDRDDSDANEEAA